MGLSLKYRPVFKGNLITAVISSFVFLFPSIGLLRSLSKVSQHQAGAIQGSFANCNISVDLDLFNGGITEYI